MSVRLRILLISAISAVLLAVVVGGVYWACQAAPAFYQEALAQNQLAAERASQLLVRQAATLAGDVRRQGRWQAMFTAAQINGWLAYDESRHQDGLFSRQIRDFRVDIQNDRSQVVFRWQTAIWTAVVSLETEIYLRETNVVAVRICRARAGMLPLPLGGWLDELVESGRKIGLIIERQEIDGDPLLVVKLPFADGPGNERSLCVESLELTNGEVFVAGHSGRERDGAPLVRRGESNGKPASEAQVEKANIQR